MRAKHDKRVLALLLLWLCLAAQAQQLNDTHMEKLFAMRVKSLDEFMARFNAKEVPPSVSRNDPQLRSKCIFSLFDYQMKGGTRQELYNRFMDFIGTVERNAVSLSPTDSLYFAEAHCQVTYKGKTHRLNIVLNYERAQGNLYGWHIAGVNGLQATGILGKPARRDMAPVQNEVDFIELGQSINDDTSNIFGYASGRAQTDLLSCFFTLVREGGLRFRLCEKVSYHFLNVPGYVFRLDTFVRDDDNSGLLISSLQRLSEQEKQAYIKKLLNN